MKDCLTDMFGTQLACC